MAHLLEFRSSQVAGHSVKLALVLLACGSSSAVNAPPPAPPVQCKLGAPPPAAPPKVVAGYPPKFPVLAAADRAKKKATLEKKVPGWSVELDETGYVREVIDSLDAPYEEHVSPERVARVQHVLDALADDLDVPKGTRARADGRYVHVDGPADTTGRFTIQQVASSAKVGRMHIGVSGRPPLSRTFHELDDLELRARWGPSDDREVRILGTTRGQPCDPVRPGDCAGAGPHDVVRCVAVKKLLLVRKEARSADGSVRDVVELGCPEAPSGYESCTIETSLPACVDGVTGETLADSVCAAAQKR